LFGGSLISLTSSWSYLVALLASVFAHTHTYTAVGVASLARFVPAFVFSAYGGWSLRLRPGAAVGTADITSMLCRPRSTTVAASSGPVRLAVT
jgi:hypothetical protein